MSAMPPDAGRPGQPGRPRGPVDGATPPMPRVSPEAGVTDVDLDNATHTSHTPKSVMREVPKRAQEAAAHTAHIAADKAEHARDRAVAAGRQIGEHTPDSVKSATGEAVSQARKRPASVVGVVVVSAVVLLWVRRARRS